MHHVLHPDSMRLQRPERMPPEAIQLVGYSSARAGFERQADRETFSRENIASHQAGSIIRDIVTNRP
jgi:hypothetical protein